MREKMLQLTRWTITTAIAFLLISTNSFVQAQSMNCGFNEVFDENMTNGSFFYDNFYENEDLVIETMNNPQMLQLLGSNSNYTIPVVVHVMHLGEPENIGSNIPDTQIIQAIQDLNNIFANTNGMGVDIGIQFCLAERTPEGDSTDGIIRANAAGICAGPCYASSLGITVGGPLDQAVKAESIWPNDEYINIWVVHNIIGAAGYASFPGTPSSVDGIVVDKDFFGIDGSNVLGHEAGHFFNLFHTFQGDCAPGTNCSGANCNQTICPTNNPCDNDPSNDMDEVCCRVQGDRVCDTPPHRRSCLDCNDTGTNDCDNGSSNALFVHNYMDYSSLTTCMDQFTDGQRMRMRCALMELRAPLMISPGCDPACTTAVAKFSGPPSADFETSVTFTNFSTGGTDETWEVNGTEINTGNSQSNLVHYFDAPGFYEICLTVSNADCTNTSCTNILIIGVDPCTDFNLDECEQLLNGDISQVENDSNHHFELTYEFDKVCNWFNRRRSPQFCYDEVNGNSFILYINPSNNESVSTQRELDLIPGKEYYIRFDYGVAFNTPAESIMESFSVGLSKSFYEGDHNKVIAFFQNPPNDQPKADGCSLIRPSYYEGCFTYEEGDGKFLYIEGESPGSNILSIANISIDPCKEDICEAEPAITYIQDSCAFTFTAVNTGAPGDCYWDLGDGPIVEGCEVSHEYIIGGTFTVCLTIACSEYAQVTVCDTITVSEDCEDCTFLETPVIATQCEEDSTSSYFAKIDFDIPAGYTPCSDNGLFVWSNDVFISVTSFLIENVDSTTDHVIGCFNLTPYQGYDFETNGATVYITLCSPDGEMVCYSFNASGTTCENCLDDEVISVAVCEDPDLGDDIYLYEGSAEIIFPNIPGVTYEECGYTSTEAGYTQTVSGSNPFTVDYTIATTTVGAFEASTLLCFTSTEVDEVSQEKVIKEFCLTLTISVEPCPPLPEECVERWSTKSMSCDSTSNGNAYFNFSMDLSSSGYEICEGGLFGIAEGGGTVAVNSGTIIGGTFSYDVDILMPCGFDQSLVYEVRLFLCNDRGDVICFLFPFRFSCEKECDIRDDDERGDGEGNNGSLGGGRSETGMPSDGIAIFPNPTSDRITIQLSNETAEQYTIYILDHLGRVLLSKGMTSSIENIDLSQMTPGLHFVRILDQENNTVKIQKIVVLE